MCELASSPINFISRCLRNSLHFRSALSRLLRMLFAAQTKAAKEIGREVTTTFSTHGPALDLRLGPFPFFSPCVLSSLPRNPHWNSSALPLTNNPIISPKSPNTLLKISITSTFTNSVLSAASASAALDPLMPTLTPQIRLHMPTVTPDQKSA
jgi:hypothetical protein